MPTVLRFEGLRAVAYPNDHRPAHVHVIGRGREGVFNLHCPHGPAELRENYGFSRGEIGRIEAAFGGASSTTLCRLGGDSWKRMISLLLQAGVEHK